MSFYLDLIVVALLPAAALFTVLQTQPYSALVSRGILGAAAVLAYAVLGAPDVALTEALVGTFLTVVLFAVTVRSTLVLRLGRLSGTDELPADHPLRRLCAAYKLRLKSTAYRSEEQLAEALCAGEIDAVFVLPGMAATAQLAASAPADAPFILLARHGRWHEQKLQALFPELPGLQRIGSARKGEG